MHMGMSHVYSEQPFGSLAGQLVGYRKNGRPIYVPAGGSTPPESQSPPAPPGQIPVVIPAAPTAPPTAITPQQLQDMQAQWQRDAEARLTAQRQELEESFNQRLKPFETEAAERQRLAEEATAAAAEAERLRIAAEETAAQRAERMATETNTRVAELTAQIAQRDALLEKEQRLNQINDYRAQQIALHTNDIHPAMHSMVTGFSEADIDASIGRAKTASEAILTEMAGIQAQQQGAAALLQRAMPGASVTAPAAGPLEAQASTRNLSAEDIANMDMAEFARMRPQLMAAASAAYRGQ